MGALRSRWMLGNHSSTLELGRGHLDALRAAVGRAGAVAGVLLLLTALASLWSPSGARAALEPKAGPAVVRELVELRTERSKTELLADGSRKTTTTGAAMHFRAGGEWRRVDTTLKAAASPGAVVNTAAGFVLSVPRDLGSGAVRVGGAGGGESVSLAPRGAQGAAKVAANTATFVDAYPQADVEYASSAFGVKETINLKAAWAPRSFVFDMALSDGLTPSLVSDGSVVVRRGDGSRMATLPAPWMRDAAGAVSRQASYALDHVDGAWRLTLSVGEEWVSSSERVFPVALDPTVYLTQSVGCTLNSAAPTTSVCSGPLTVGRTGTSVRRAVLRFGDVVTDIPRDAKITNAKVNAWVPAGGIATAFDVDTHQLKQSFSAPTWQNASASTPWTAGGNFEARREHRFTMQPAYSDGYVPLGVSRLVEGWLDGSIANDGILVKAADESLDRLMTLDDFTGGHPPVLEVVWEPRRGNGPYTLDSQTLTDRSSLAVNVANGNLVVQANDVSINGTGLNTSVTRTYNSEEYGGELGHGWRLDQGPDLRLNETWWDRARVLRWVDGSQYRFERNPDNTFATAAGLPAHLTQRAATHPDGAGFDLTFDRTGTRYVFDDFSSGSYLQKVVDRNGNVLKTDYGANGLGTIKNPQNEALTATYDPTEGLLTGLTDWTGRTWGYAYTGGRLTKTTNPDGQDTLYAYTTTGTPRLNKITDPQGRITHITYDTDGRVASVKRQVDGTTTNDITTTYAYSAPTTPCNATAGHLRKTIATNGRGHATTYCSDRRNQIVAAYDPLGNRTENTFTPNGDVTEFKNTPGGSASSTTLLNYESTGVDPSNNLTNGNAPGQKAFTINYRPTSATDPLDRYRATKFTGADGSQEFYDYDAKGNIKTVGDTQTSPANKASLTYHANGLIDTATDGNLGVTTYGQAEGSNPTSGNITSITPPVPLGATTLTYDALNRVKTVTDAKSQVRTLTYDKQDRVTRIDLSDGSWTAYTYDAAGNQLTRTTSTAANSTYTYDPLNRRLTETTTGSRTASYTYDKAGNLLTLTDPAGTVTYAHDAINRVTSITQPGNRTTTRAYTNVDLAGRDVLDVTTTFPTGYQELRRLNAAGDVERIDWKTSATGTTERRLAYDYGTLGNASPLLAQLTDSNPSTSTTTRAESYAYDGLARLSTITTTTPSPTTTTSYTYDNASNRTRTDTLQSGATSSVSRAFNAANQICWQANISTAANCTTVPFGATTFVYDQIGNRTSSNDAKTYAYDQLDRLTSLNGAALSYLSPTNSDIDSAQGVAQQTNLTGVGRIGTTAYTRTPDGELLSQRPATGDPAYTLSDRLGSTIGVVSTTGGITRRYSYTPDGADSTNGTGPTIPFRYAGGQKIDNLTHFAARYYDAASTQWTQPDPLNQQTDLRQANLYTYVGGDPVNITDLSGQGFFRDGVRALTSTARSTVKGAVEGIGYGALAGCVIGNEVAGGVGCKAGAAALTGPGAIGGAAYGYGRGVYRVATR